jgi:hypothetical protein
LDGFDDNDACRTTGGGGRGSAFASSTTVLSASANILAAERVLVVPLGLPRLRLGSTSGIGVTSGILVSLLVVVVVGGGDCEVASDAGDAAEEDVAADPATPPTDSIPMDEVTAGGASSYCSWCRC